MVSVPPNKDFTWPNRGFLQPDKVTASAEQVNAGPNKVSGGPNEDSLRTNLVAIDHFIVRRYAKRSRTCSGWSASSNPSGMRERRRYLASRISGFGMRRSAAPA
jgi:hypothetical protein